MDKKELIRRQALPLAEKIAMSRARIREWYEAFDGNVAVSTSGGVDSRVLDHLVHLDFPEVPSLFVNTGLEYPELVESVKADSHVVTVRPKMPFHKVIEKHGWPVVSKKWARVIHDLQNPHDGNINTRRLYWEGVRQDGVYSPSWKLSQCWRYLVDAPFKISSRCCDEMKKKPFHAYQRETGRRFYVGTMAEEGKQRESSYLKSGCNAFDTVDPQSRPLSFWTKSDVLEYIQANNLEYPSVYGDIIKQDGQYRTTGVHRTGCIFCCFGLHMERQPNRFQQLYYSHPKLWDYCMNTLGLAEVLRYMRINGDPRMAHKVATRPYPTDQAELPTAANA